MRDEVFQYTENELYHHGILGQRWGIRRYQNPDGSLTPAGQKRYNKLTEKSKKYDTQKRILTGESKEEAKKPVQKTFLDMDDAELESTINRMRSEKSYLQLRSELMSMLATPITESKGKKAAKEVWDVILKPGLENAGKKMFDSVIDKSVKNLLGDMYTDVSYTNTKKPTDKMKKRETRFDD